MPRKKRVSQKRRVPKKKKNQKTKKTQKSKKKKVQKKEKKEKLVGKITHYFSKIKVGVIKLSAPLSQGDTIRIVGGEETDFKQNVKSMEIEHKKIKRAKKGQEIGLKVKEKVREGYKVYKVQ